MTAPTALTIISAAVLAFGWLTFGPAVLLVPVAAAVVVAGLAVSAS